jgi:Ca2+:H+ antiporter
MIVRTSILGSIIVNILLVLGLVVLTGEMQERGQTYNLLATQVAAGLLCLAAVILLVPVRSEVCPGVYSQLTRLA